MDELLLGVDVGTTSTKAVLCDQSGAEIAGAEKSYRLHMPHPGWAEQEPEEVWEALVEVLGTLAGPARERGRIRAIALAAQSGSLLPARADGAPLAPIVTWLDGRTEALVRRWRADGLENGVRAISGWHLYAGLCLPTIAWFRDEQPHLFAAAERFLSVNDFLVYRLTGRFCTNPSNAGGMQLLDISTGAWSEALCAMAGITPAQLSPIMPSGAVIGTISPEVSRLTGLPAETWVVNGAHDQSCTALALGIHRPGNMLLGCGTSWVFTAVTASPAIEALPPTLDLHFHPMPGRWTASQSLGGLGASLEWAVERLWPGLDRAAAFAALDAELAETAPGAGGLFFRPLAGGHKEPAGRQAGGIWGLRLAHTRADVARAGMEGAAYELRWALEPVRRAGMPVERMGMIGGAASSPWWPAIVADVTGVSLWLPQGKNWPAVGAAMLAGIGIGAFSSWEDAQKRFQRPSSSLEPDPHRREIYEALYAAYRKKISEQEREA